MNCYLIRAESGYVLVDTGVGGSRKLLEKRLKEAGCQPGDLKLVILTHGDSDHAGNAAYLREKFGAKISLHAADVPMVETGDMGWKRKARPDQVSPVFRVIMAASPLFVRAARFEVFKPDFTLDEDFDLSAFGLNARIIHLPGHSKGSIGVLTAAGDLFCGDFVYNMAGFNMIDDLADHRASYEKIKGLDVKALHPGHGGAIPFDRFLRKYK